MPQEATFFGSEYLSYDLSQKGEPVVSTNDHVTFQFKTQQANGLLFYTGDGSDFLVVALLEGGLLVHITLLSGSFEVEIAPSKGFQRFDDNKWHSVIVERKSREPGLWDVFLSCCYPRPYEPDENSIEAKQRTRSLSINYPIASFHYQKPQWLEYCAAKLRLVRSNPRQAIILGIRFSWQLPLGNICQL
ncbi:hypothetical protein LSH36_1g09011 [Paralvinella palmiformis]|uniref:Laminin G domain-containing protein n=1 Tax=Paralvinella palmiformis TaxID=53620 RepID=A0AAD9KH39_9ANNE|nr:hypothetical protein LSH36_1g09011 [Paralvinella palmiformis]